MNRRWRGRSRKDSRRRIVVEGRIYHWRGGPDGGFVALPVRAEGSVGPRPWAQIRHFDDAEGHRLVTPKAVRHAVLAGHSRGWDPAVTKPPLFRLYDADSLISPEERPRTTSRRI